MTRSATPEDVKLAFRRQAKNIHPDVNPDPGAAQQFIELVKAYQVLLDNGRRAAYDRQIDLGRVPQGPPSTPPSPRQAAQQQQGAAAPGAARQRPAGPSSQRGQQQQQQQGRRAWEVSEEDPDLDEALRAALRKARGIVQDADAARYLAQLATKNAEIAKSQAHRQV